MSPALKSNKMDYCLNIILMCGLLIASLQGTDGSRLPRSKTYKSQMLKMNIHSLQEHYNTLGTEWVENSVFASYLDQLQSRGSCTCQSMLLDGMLKIYQQIFTDMLNKSENKELRASIKDIMSEVQKLRHKYSDEHKLWKELQDINSVKVKNGTVQGTALNEFLMVFNRAYTEKHQDSIH